MKPIRSKAKLILYAFGALGVNFLNLIMGSYLCSAIIADGFAEAQWATHTFAGSQGIMYLVAPGLWAIFGVIAKVIDGVIDIPMAQLTDRLKSRWGRRRPSLIIGLVPMTLAYVAFAVFVPQLAEKSLLNTWYYFIILAIFYSFYTLTMVTYYATFTEIVDNEKDRRFLSNTKSIADITYFIFGFALVPMILKGLNIKFVALICLPLVLLMLIPLFMIKENSTKDGVGEVEKTVNIFKSVGYTFKNKDFIIWMIVYSFMTLGLQLFLNGINEYFSITGLPMTPVMAAAFSPVPFTFIIYNKLIAKKGFKFAYQYTLLIFALGMLAFFGISLLNTSTTVKMILGMTCGVCSSFSIGAMFAVAYSIPSQLAADDEKRTGISHSAMYFAVQGLFSGVASGIGGTAILTLLKATKLFDNKGTFYITVVAAIAALIAFGLAFLLPKSISELGREHKNKDPKDPEPQPVEEEKAEELQKDQVEADLLEGSAETEQ